jgi:hypothetical protein
MARTPATTCSLLYDVAKNMTLRQSEKCEVLRTSVANNVQRKAGMCYIYGSPVTAGAPLNYGGVVFALR